MANDEARFCVIAYDVSSDRRRRLLEKVVGAYAVRIQGSVFEGRLTERQVAALVRRAERLIASPDDSLRVYRLCTDCGERVTGLGGTCSNAPAQPDVFAM